MRLFAKRLFALALLLVPLAAPAGASGVSALYVFGDSLSDQGNLRAITGGAAPVAPTYPVGTFSNGPTWADGLSRTLGLGPSLPSLLGGTNFAFGLARTDSADPGLGIPASINLPGQVQAYVAGPNAPSGALFAVWAGANNLLQALAAASGQPDPPAYLAAEAAGAVGGVLAALETLRLDGARDFLVLNMPDLGRVPRFTVSPQVSAIATGVSQGFNQGLAQGLAAFDAIPGVNLRTVDVFALFQEVFANPGGSGLTNLATPCITGPVPDIYLNPLAATNGCTPAQAATTLFWDPIHPTAAGHAQVAAAAIAVVPAPAAAGLLAFALLGLVALRRRG
ncbi:MAG: SGNH/GDSL hydrolase family protein [Rubritepida sp.]|jgi:phospholipase/lecithinase/hemolysin|nr:SGNH/GDSL hydrolase family protein [Rubritepida sp.]